MLQRLTPAWRNAILITLGVLLLWFCWSVRAVLNPLIAAYFLAYVVHPMVVRLERRGFSRRAAVNVIFIGALLSTVLVLGMVFVQGRGLVKEVVRENGLISKVEQRLDTFIGEHEDKFQWLLDRIRDDEVQEEDSAAEDGATPPSSEGVKEQLTAEGVEGDPTVGVGEEQPTNADGEDELVAAAGDSEPISEDDDEESIDFQEFARQVIARVGAEWAGPEGVNVTQAGKVGLTAAEGIAQFAASLFGSFFAFMTFLFLLPIYTWFLLFELGNIHSFITRYLPRQDRAKLTSIGRQIGEVLSSFFRGRLLVVFLKGLYMTIFLWLVGVEYPLLIGLGSGFLSLVPFVGAFIGGVLAFAVANLSLPFGHALLWIVVIFSSAEMIEGYILIPKIIGDSLGLHPLVVLFSVFLGGAALGVFGLLLALPLTASLLILVREFVLPALADLADEK